MRFIVTGGGTGGHIYPALAIAKGLQEKYPRAEILYIGKEKGLEEDLVPAAGINFQPLRVQGLQRRVSLSNLFALAKAGIAFFQAGRIIARYKPLVVVGTGGYVSGPVLLAAAWRKVPTLIHEQNARPGITTRFLARFVNFVAITFPDSKRYLPRRARCRLTGLPVRPEFLTLERKQSRKKMGLPEGSFFILSFGGSQGARTINLAMHEVMKKIGKKKDLFFLHVTGPGKHEDFKKGFQIPETGNTNIVPYLYEMPLALFAADLVICRAGAATLAEITVAGAPAILIPYPYAVDNHQEFNARVLEKEGAAIVIRDRILSGEMLANQIERLYAEPKRLRKMAEASKRLGRPHALTALLGCVEELIPKDKRLV